MRLHLRRDEARPEPALRRRQERPNCQERPDRKRAFAHRRPARKVNQVAVLPALRYLVEGVEAGRDARYRLALLLASRLHSRAVSITSST